MASATGRAPSAAQRRPPRQALDERCEGRWVRLLVEGVPATGNGRARDTPAPPCAPSLAPTQYLRGAGTVGGRVPVQHALSHAETDPTYSEAPYQNRG